MHSDFTAPCWPGILSPTQTFVQEEIQDSGLFLSLFTYAGGSHINLASSAWAAVLICLWLRLCVGNQ